MAAKNNMTDVESRLSQLEDRIDKLNKGTDNAISIINYWAMTTDPDVYGHNGLVNWYQWKSAEEELQKLRKENEELKHKVGHNDTGEDST